MTFSELLTREIHRAAQNDRVRPAGECETSRGLVCPLCHAARIGYESEIRLKQAALNTFWDATARGTALLPIVPSPMGRFYRTVSKRKVFRRRTDVMLALLSPGEGEAATPVDVVRCAIEPANHAALYAWLEDQLARPDTRSLADALTYVIIKGNYREWTVILNVRSLSPGVVKSATKLSRALLPRFRDVTSFFLYEDPSAGRYYLGKSERRPGRLKRIHGKSEIIHRVGSRTFSYSPAAFSQVNHSIVETFVNQAAAMLALEKRMSLYDLYCGYGLFSLCLAGCIARAVGVDADGDSIRSAGENARRQRVTNVRFLRRMITVDALPAVISGLRPHDAVLLDPPRKGTAPGVIDCIAARGPSRVLHIFCAIDLMPSELKRWRECGYEITAAVPVDMFPGTSAIEMMVGLRRK